jgi:hypothetical protein
VQQAELLGVAAMPTEETPPQTWVVRFSEGLGLVVSAAGFSLVLYGALARHEQLTDFLLFWLLSDAATPSRRLPTPSRLTWTRLTGISDWIGIGAGVLSLLVGLFVLRPMIFVGLTLCLSTWGSIVDRRSAERATKPAWRLLLTLGALVSICLWLWWVTRPAS